MSRRPRGFTTTWFPTLRVPYVPATAEAWWVESVLRDGTRADASWCSPDDWYEAARAVLAERSPV